MIRPREDLIVEADHHHGDAECRPQHRLEHADETDAARLQCRDLVLGCQPAERVQRSNENRHRQRQSDCQRNGEPEEFSDDEGRQALAHQLPEMLSDVLQQQDRSERCESKRERAYVFL